MSLKKALAVTLTIGALTIIAGVLTISKTSSTIDPEPVALITLFAAFLIGIILRHISFSQRSK